MNIIVIYFYLIWIDFNTRKGRGGFFYITHSASSTTMLNGLYWILTWSKYQLSSLKFVHFKLIHPQGLAPRLDHTWFPMILLFDAFPLLHEKQCISKRILSKYFLWIFIEFSRPQKGKRMGVYNYKFSFSSKTSPSILLLKLKKKKVSNWGPLSSLFIPAMPSPR